MSPYSLSLPRREPRPRRHVMLVSAIAVVACWSCATTGQAPDRGTVDAAIRARTNQGIRVEGIASMPPDIAMEDGLTPDEAVSIALWNSPSFQATLVDLGIARADLVEAGLLRNPVFSFLFPLGPKQLEWTLQFPFDAGGLVVSAPFDGIVQSLSAVPGQTVAAAAALLEIAQVATL